MTVISFSPQIKLGKRYMVSDTVFTYALALSIFTPYYCTVAVVCIIAAIQFICPQKRARLFITPIEKKLPLFFLFPFCIAIFHQNLTGMAYALLMLAVIICGCFLKNTMNRVIYDSVLDLSCVCSIGCTGIAIFQKVQMWSTAPYFRPMAVFFNANYYGTITVMIVLICLYRIFSGEHTKWLYYAGIFCNAVGLYLCGSMSSLTALICGIFVMLVLFRKTKAAKLFLTVAALCIVLCILFPELYPRLDEVDSTFGQRLSIWKASIKGFMEYPFFGRGAGAYETIYTKFSSFPSFHCHNIILDILLNFGLVGFTAFSVFIVVLIRRLYLQYHRNMYKNRSILLASVFTAAVVHGMTDVSYFWIQTGLFFVVIISSMGIDRIDDKFSLYSFGKALFPSSGKNPNTEVQYLSKEGH